MKVGNGGCHPGGCGGPQQARGGSGPKVKGGSGEQGQQCGSGEKDAAKAAGIPYGQYKKQFHEDSFAQPTGGSLLGNVMGGVANFLGGFGGYNNSYLGQYGQSTPQAVAQKNATPTVPAFDPNAAAAKPAQAKPLPGISQMDPAGKDGSYTNAAMNCGPTVLAMLGEAFGKKPANLTEAQYINALGVKAGTTEQGTTGNGMIAALNDMGFQTAANKGGDLNWINSQLQQGHEVFANGDYYSLPGHSDPKLIAGHYAAITGFDGTNYTVNDPANGSVLQMSPQDLANFIGHAPEGGFTLSAWPEAIVG